MKPQLTNMKYIRTIWHEIDVNSNYVKTEVFYYELGGDEYCERYVIFSEDKILGGDLNAGYNSQFPPEGKISIVKNQLNQGDEFIQTDYIEKELFENIWNLMKSQKDFGLIPYPNIRKI